MTREVWFKEDIGQVLLAVGEASRSAGGLAAEVGADASLVRAYQAGFQAALKSLALAFGLLDLAGSLPRSWVTVLDGPGERGWGWALGPGDETCPAERDAGGEKVRTWEETVAW